MGGQEQRAGIKFPCNISDTWKTFCIKNFSLLLPPPLLKGYFIFERKISGSLTFWPLNNIEICHISPQISKEETGIKLTKEIE
jgi:hypothetical protein